MQKTIQFSGHTAVPSDHDAPDGTLAQAFNLSADTDLGLQPVGEPITIDSPRQGWTARYIHNLPSGEDTVIYLGSDNKLAFAIMANKSVGELVTIDGPALSGCEPQSIQFTSIGNILIAHSQELSMQYYLWRGDSYQALGNRPGFPVLEFGLQRKTSLDNQLVYTEYDAGTDEHGDALTLLPYNSIVSTTATNTRTQAIKSFCEAITNGVYGKLFDAINKKVDENGLLFYQPFMLRYAVRMFNGDYIWHSPPVLMLPSTTIPIISVKEFYGPRKDQVYYATSDLSNIFLYGLKYRILRTDQWKAWKDIISGIDIFISAPFYTFDQSSAIEGRGDICFATKDKYFTRNEESGYVSNADRINGHIGGIYSEGENKQYTLHEVLEKISIHGPHIGVADETVIRMGYWRIPDRTHKLESDIRDCHEFYRIARLDYDDIAPTPIGNIQELDNLKDLPLEEGITYQNLVTRPTLPDDFSSHRTIYPAVSQVYNSRINLANFKVLPPQPFPIRTCLPYTNTVELSNVDEKVLITHARISYKKNNRTHYREIYANTVAFNNDLYNPWLIDTFDRNKPRYLFVPDRDAFEIIFWYRESKDAQEEQCISYKLTPHQFLNGAYYYAGLYIPPEQSRAPGNTNPSQAEFPVNQPYLLSNQLYTSQANNPFIFPPLNATTVGNGTIMALASAAKPLSQGQFGQYPLYAFTDEGVWALSISDNGTFSARQPITRHTLASPHAICTLDSSVAFIAPQGLILLSGSQASHLSHTINSIAISSFTSLKGLRELLPDHARYTLPLSLFLKTARIAYDSINSRIILYRPLNTYAYIYNLRSQQWTLMAANIHHTLNSYPHTYAVDTHGAIIKPFRSSPGAANIAIITRPLKLDLPDALKTIRQLYIRGQFTPGHIQCALYGSRDLKHWHLIASSRDHRIRRISGTPYKYFTLAVLGKLSATESVTSFDVEFLPRYTNRLR